MKFILPFLLMASTALGAIAPADKAELGVSKNYAINGGFERGLYGVKVYKDTAGVLPVNGAGTGASHLTIAASTSAPLADSRSLIITNSGSTSAQGEGVVLSTFTIDSGAKTQPLYISMDYTIVSGTYSGGTTTTDSDVETYLYDVTNAKIIQPTGYKLSCAVVGINCTTQAIFQPDSTATSFRLLAHVAGTNTTAWALKADNLVISRQKTVTGSAETDLVDAGPTVVTATTTNPTKGTVSRDKIFWGRRGDHAHIRIDYKQYGAGAAGAGYYLFQLPNGMAFDSSKVVYYTADQTTSNGATSPSGTSDAPTKLGFASATLSSSQPSSAFGYAVPYDATHFRLYLTYSIANGSPGSGGGYMGSGFYQTSFADTLTWGADFDAPIQGWSSNTAMSSDSSGRIVAFKGVTTTTQAVASSTEVTVAFNSTIWDTTGSWNGTLNRWIAPEPGYYRVKGKIAYAANATGARYCYSRINGTNTNAIGIGPVAAAQTSSDFGTAICDDTFILKAGDYVDIQSAQLSGTTLNISYGNSVSEQRTSLEISKVQAGTMQAAATESVNARYSSNTGQTVGTSGTTLSFATKDIDSHGAWNGTTFTCPAPGKYMTTVLITTTNSVSYPASTGFLDVNLFKNGTFISELGEVNGNGGTGVFYRAGGSDIFSCMSGDQMTIQANSSTSSPLYTDPRSNHVEFHRIGN